ncbi:hypothetical protein Patl1_06244 [Pistacia atlantica]|uniref:Uncharacterized protein n=1 Tax=Pistacia atlantica TaxID=434234 RepID=A0ACC1BTC8_9ROSI|nr:hypothetical protein Patl1_06244 [Pistacia atlantica]
MATSKVKLKLLIDTKGQKVLFAEASKDFVDFLLYIFSLPVGTVVKLLIGKSSVGYLDKLYESIENLDETYMQPNQDMNSVLNPKTSMSATGIPLLHSHPHCESKTRKFYTCATPSAHTSNQSPFGSNNISFGFTPTYHFNVSGVANVLCPRCKALMSREITCTSPGGEKTIAN